MYFYKKIVRRHYFLDTLIWGTMWSCPIGSRDQTCSRGPDLAQSTKCFLTNMRHYVVMSDRLARSNVQQRPRFGPDLAQIRFHPEPRFELGNFCMRSECVTTTLPCRLLDLTIVFTHCLGMKGWSAISNAESTVELQSIKGEELIDVLEQFACQTQIDPIPLISMSSSILKIIKDLLLQIKKSVGNYDCDNGLPEVVSSTRKVSVAMDKYLCSISPPRDPELCDAHLATMGLAVANLVLVSQNILTNSPWLQCWKDNFKTFSIQPRSSLYLIRNRRYERKRLAHAKRLFLNAGHPVPWLKIQLYTVVTPRAPAPTEGGNLVVHCTDDMQHGLSRISYQYSPFFSTVHPPKSCAELFCVSITC
eukprot:sb/3465988/